MFQFLMTLVACIRSILMGDRNLIKLRTTDCWGGSHFWTHKLYIRFSSIAGY